MFLLPVSAASQLTILGTFFAVVFTFYLIPLTISSPCIMEKKDLGPKPALIGHRGAPMVSTPRGGPGQQPLQERSLWEMNVIGLCQQIYCQHKRTAWFGLICLKQTGI